MIKKRYALWERFTRWWRGDFDCPECGITRNRSQVLISFCCQHCGFPKPPPLPAPKPQITWNPCYSSADMCLEVPSRTQRKGDVR